MGLTPASLRAGGATHFYRVTDSADWVRFRGSWSNQRMLEIYIQEVGADAILRELPAQDLDHVRLFASSAESVLSRRFI